MSQARPSAAPSRGGTSVPCRLTEIAQESTMSEDVRTDTRAAEGTARVATDHDVIAHLLVERLAKRACAA